MQVQMVIFVLVALALVVFMGLCAAPGGQGRPRRGLWRWPAVVAAMFLAFSLYTLIQEGPLGVVHEHTRTWWSSQIWIDLVLGVALAWALLLPRARQLGMRWPWWGALVVLTGNIGVLAFMARLLWLQERAR